MKSIDLQITTIIRGNPRARPAKLLTILVLCSAAYGAAMGGGGQIIGDRPLQIVYSAIKLPVLLLATFAICLPSFFVMTTLLGVREDLARALRSLLLSQAVLTVVLMSLAPLTMFWYVSSADHEGHILFNAIVFAVAGASAQVVLRRAYRPLIERYRAHVWLLRWWLVVYAFVGVQAAWVLRPFIGDPGRATQFFRDDPWSNAYVWVVRMIGRVIFAR